jgi:hypothetical protein
MMQPSIHLLFSFSVRQSTLYEAMESREDRTLHPCPTPDKDPVSDRMALQLSERRPQRVFQSLVLKTTP